MKKLLNPTSVHWSKVALNHQFTYFTKLKNGKSEYKFKEYERIQMTFSAFQDKRYELSSIFYQQVLIYFQCGNWNYYLWSYLMDSALHCDDTLFFKKKIGNDIVLQLLELEVLIFMQPSSSISAITRYVKVHLIMLIHLIICF